MIYKLVYKIINFIKLNFIPILLVLLSIYDLRIDLRIMYDSFTVSSLFYTFSEHPLAIVVLFSCPRLFDFSRKL